MGTALAERPYSAENNTITDKQAAFITAYTEDGDTYLNATRSARRAGYAQPHVAAFEVLSNPRVKARVREALAGRARSPEEIIAKLETWMDADLGDCIDIQEDGGWRLNLVKAKELGKLGSIDTLKDGKYGTEIKLKSSLQAAEVLAKVHKLFGDPAVNVSLGAGLEDAQAKLQRHAEIAVRMLKDLVEAGKIDLPQLLGQTLEQFPHLAETLMMARPIEGSFKEEQAESGEVAEIDAVGTPYTRPAASGGMIARPEQGASVGEDEAVILPAEPVEPDGMEVYVPRRRRAP